MPALSANILKTCFTSESLRLMLIGIFLSVKLTSPFNFKELRSLSSLRSNGLSGSPYCITAASSIAKDVNKPLENINVVNINPAINFFIILFFISAPDFYLHLFFIDSIFSAAKLSFQVRNCVEVNSFACK